VSLVFELAVLLVVGLLLLESDPGDGVQQTGYLQRTVGVVLVGDDGVAVYPNRRRRVIAHVVGGVDEDSIVVAGVCMPPDSFRPSFGIYKRLNIQFVFGWTPEEFAASLHNLADPENHVKVLVRPNLD
jgi:hypothetical protein